MDRFEGFPNNHGNKDNKCQILFKNLTIFQKLKILLKLKAYSKMQLEMGTTQNSQNNFEIKKVGILKIPDFKTQSKTTTIKRVDVGIKGRHRDQ